MQQLFFLGKDAKFQVAVNKELIRKQTQKDCQYILVYLFVTYLVISVDMTLEVCVFNNI